MQCWKCYIFREFPISHPFLAIPLCLSCTLLLFPSHYFPVSSYSSLQRLSIYISLSFSHTLFLYHSFLFTQFSISLFDCSLNTRRNFSLSPPSLMPSSLPSPPFNLIHSIPLPCVIVQKMLCYLELGVTIYLHSCRTAARCYGVVVGFRGWGWEGREVLKFALFSYVHNLKFEVLNTKKTNVYLCKCILMSLQ